MSPTEKVVLIALASTLGDEFYWPFDPVMRHTQLERRVVRRCCRSLARKGFAEYARGLWTEDGDAAGSGYKVTKQGTAFLADGAAPDAAKVRAPK